MVACSPRSSAKLYSKSATRETISSVFLDKKLFMKLLVFLRNFVDHLLDIFVPVSNAFSGHKMSDKMTTGNIEIYADTHLNDVDNVDKNLWDK